MKNLFLRNKRFLCFQQIITSQNKGDVKVTIIMRNVGAKDKAEAIKKFISKTNYIKCVEKLDVSAFKLSGLSKID